MPLDDIFRSFPQLETQNLILRRILPTDASDLFRILGDDDVTRFYDDTTFQILSQADEQITAWENGYQNRRCLRWGIAHKKVSGIVGTCGYYGFHTWHMRAGIGYELERSHWRQGVMMEALNAIIVLGFEEMGLNRIEAVVMPENIPSLKLLEKLGFRKEGVLKEYENWGSKGFTDLCMLALTRTSWGK